MSRYQLLHIAMWGVISCIGYGYNSLMIDLYYQCSVLFSDLSFPSFLLFNPSVSFSSILTL